MPNRTRLQHKSGQSQESRSLGYRLIILAAVLNGAGLLMIYSSSAVLAFYRGLSPFYYFFLQCLWLIGGIVLAYLAYKVPLKWLPKSSVIIMVVTIVLLVVVLFAGKNLNGARRWIDLGSFDLQPSEVAKLGFVIYLSAWLARARPKVKNIRDAIRHHFNYDILPFMLLMGIVCVLIVLQPDLDTALIIAATALSVYFVSGRDALHTLGSIFIIFTTGVVGLFAALKAEYRLSRVTTFIDFITKGQFDYKLKTGAGLQVWNGLVAIGSGGIWGLGFTESRQKFYYLQNAAFTDSIFAIIAEEFGLIGSLALILAFLYFMSLGINIARRAPDNFSALLAVGITTWITLQAFLNIGANLALIPFGGIPLPFISYGGSNALAVMIGVGLLLNVNKNSK